MFVLELPLKTTEYDEQVLDKRFRLLNKGHNVVVKHEKKLMAALGRDREYQALLEKRKPLKEEVRRLEGSRKPGKKRKPGKALKDAKAALAEVDEQLSVIRKSYGLTEAGLQSYGKVFQQAHREHISSQMMQKECSFVWAGVEKVLFGKGKDIHFRKLSSMHTLPSKSATNGIRFYDARRNPLPGNITPKYPMGIEYLGLQVAVAWKAKDSRDLYKAEALSRPLKYASITRKMFASGWRYYVQLTLEGEAPKKIRPDELGSGTMGCDPGTSTFAAMSDDTATLEELAPGCKKYNKAISALQLRTDRSKRAMNPGNYNPDGTVKKGRRKWRLSRTCRKRQRAITSLYRKKAAYIKCEHNARANRVVRVCSAFVAEAMDFKALARKSKAPAERQDKTSTVKQKDGTIKEVKKFKRKKRFGRSVNDRAPAGQLSAIRRKMEQYGGLYLETDTRKVKASQYDHVTGTCTKAGLGCRFKDVGGHQVQRDLYSAFLTKNAAAFLTRTDREACTRGFGNFLRLQDGLITSMKAQGISRPSCFGF